VSVQKHKKPKSIESKHIIISSLCHLILLVTERKREKIVSRYPKRIIPPKTKCNALICPSITRGNIDASSISLGISRNYANSRVYGLVSDALRCNDNKRDVAHGRQETGTSDRFSDCETTFTPRKRPSFIDPAETPGLPFFGNTVFILDAEGRRLIEYQG